MGCNCKKDKLVEDIGSTSSSDTIQRSKDVVIGSLAFILLVLPLVLFIIPFTVYMLFKALVLNSSVDITQNMASLAKTLNGKFNSNPVDEEEDSVIDGDEYELVGVDEIK
jgi:hypothetical protein